jgi:hypothetical protein
MIPTSKKSYVATGVALPGAVTVAIRLLLSSIAGHYRATQGRTA